MVALASAATLQQIEKASARELKIIAEQLNEINELDWKMIAHLIDNRNTICISKKVIVDGKEFDKAYISNLIKAFSKIKWEGLNKLLAKYQTEIVNQMLRGGRKVNVSDMLVRIDRMTKVDWANYYKSFGIIYLLFIY